MLPSFRVLRPASRLDTRCFSLGLEIDVAHCCLIWPHPTRSSYFCLGCVLQIYTWPLNPWRYEQFYSGSLKVQFSLALAGEFSSATFQFECKHFSHLKGSIWGFKQTVIMWKYIHITYNECLGDSASWERSTTHGLIIPSPLFHLSSSVKNRTVHHDCQHCSKDQPIFLTQTEVPTLC